MAFPAHFPLLFLATSVLSLCLCYSKQVSRSYVWQVREEQMKRPSSGTIFQLRCAYHNLGLPMALSSLPFACCYWCLIMSKREDLSSLGSFHPKWTRTRQWPPPPEKSVLEFPHYNTERDSLWSTMAACEEGCQVYYSPSFLLSSPLNYRQRC